MEFEEQPIVYKCVENIDQLPKFERIWQKHVPDYNIPFRGGLQIHKQE